MKTILVVDGDTSVRMLYEVELREAGYWVLSAPSGLEALEICSRHKVDLVIIDPMLRDISGRKLIDWLSSINSKIPMIVHTDHSQYKRQLKHEKIERYIRKTSDMSRLMQAVKKVVPAAHA